MKQSMTPAALGTLFSQMEMLFAAGSTPEETVMLLAEENETLNPLRDRLLGGAGFASAAAESGLFPDYACRLIALGEQTGRLEESLGSLSDYYVQQAALQNRIRTALVYPAVLLVLMCGVLGVLVFGVLPVFAGVYESLAGSLVGSSYGYVTAAEIVGKIALMVTGVVCIGTLAAVGLSRGTHPKVSEFLETFPLTQTAMEQVAVSQIGLVIAALIQSGGDGDSALSLAAEMNTHKGLGAALAECEKDLAAGEGLANALCRHGIFSVFQARLLRSSAQSGNFPETLSRVAKEAGETGQGEIIKCVDRLEPFFTVFLTVSVGMSLLGAMLPLAGILGAIG